MAGYSAVAPKFQNQTCNTRNANRWIHTTDQKYGDELRHFIHRIHSSIVTYRRFFDAESAYFSICKHNTSSLPPYKHLPTSRSDTSCVETSSMLKTNGNHLEKHQMHWKTDNQNIQSVRFCYKNANICYHHRAGPCNSNQSRAKALPVGRSREAWEGREGTPGASTQSSTRSPDQEQMMSPARKQTKLSTTDGRQAKPAKYPVSENSLFRHPRPTINDFEGFLVLWNWSGCRFRLKPWNHSGSNHSSSTVNTRVVIPKRSECRDRGVRSKCSHDRVNIRQLRWFGGIPPGKSFECESLRWLEMQTLQMSCFCESGKGTFVRDGEI